MVIYAGIAMCYIPWRGTALREFKVCLAVYHNMYMDVRCVWPRVYNNLAIHSNSAFGALVYTATDAGVLPEGAARQSCT